MLSPALLIYAVILYLYFIKIAVLWSLPKGAVASIVEKFYCGCVYIKRMSGISYPEVLRLVLDHASLAVFPALVMFWIGTLYRIREYGFTEPWFI